MTTIEPQLPQHPDSDFECQVQEALDGVQACLSRAGWHMREVNKLIVRLAIPCTTAQVTLAHRLVEESWPGIPRPRLRVSQEGRLDRNAKVAIGAIIGEK